jgi:hypothetical protein
LRVIATDDAGIVAAHFGGEIAHDYLLTDSLISGHFERLIFGLAERHQTPDGAEAPMLGKLRQRSVDLDRL